MILTKVNYNRNHIHKGMYCGLNLKPINDLYLRSVATTYGIELYPEYPPHITLIYDETTDVTDSIFNSVRAYFEELSTRSLPSSRIECDSAIVFENPEMSHLVLPVSNSLPRIFNNKLIQAGLKHSFDEYTPHVTLTSHTDAEYLKQVAKIIASYKAVYECTEFEINNVHTD